ncbi:MAG: inosine/xanthosine triphosphatase [Thermoanaerobaculia bacterium]|nr:inosine/xanthosine triphosphatase [Thermoanaerobaculia bacterium]
MTRAVRLRAVVGSLNPVKIEAARTGVQRAFPGAEVDVRGVAVPSGVSDQPMDDEETRRGALGRVEAAARALPDADLWIGMEGGLEQMQGSSGPTPDRLFAYAWVVVRRDGPDGSGRRGESRTANFELPPEVVELVRAGMELGEADDRVFGRRNSKSEEGAVGLLTRGLVTRAELYAPAVLLALVPFLRRDLFPQ